MAIINCRECGNQISDQAMECPNCGAPGYRQSAISRNTRIVTAPKSRSAAVLLAILLGGIGIHKFYLNSPGWGVIYLFFSWTFLPAIIGFIEGLSYLFMSEHAFQQKYGRAIFATMHEPSTSTPKYTRTRNKAHETPIRICPHCKAENGLFDYICPTCGEQWRPH
jgi:TM2 domain-containing membrane protein YozV